MAIKLRHIGIVVKDLQDSLKFYQELLGLPVVKDMLETGPFIEEILGFKSAQVRTVKLQTSGNGIVELLDYRIPESPASPEKKLHQNGLTHFALTVVHIDSLHKKLTDAGVEFISPPRLSPDAKAKVAFCRDPEGNFIELVEEIFHQGQ